MTLRQCQILEALLAVEEGREGGNVGTGAHPDEVKLELRRIRPYRHSSELVRRELRELGPRYVREGGAGWRGSRRHFTLTDDGRVKARELAEARGRLTREARGQ